MARRITGILRQAKEVATQIPVGSAQDAGDGGLPDTSRSVRYISPRWPPPWAGRGAAWARVKPPRSADAATRASPLAPAARCAAHLSTLLEMAFLHAGCRGQGVWVGQGMSVATAAV